MSMKNKEIELEDALEQDDWAIIIGNDGLLKGMFIPAGNEEDEVPQVIIDICKKHFGIDPTVTVSIH